MPLFGILNASFGSIHTTFKHLNTKSNFIKLEIVKTSIWRLDAWIWGFEGFFWGIFRDLISKVLFKKKVPNYYYDYYYTGKFCCFKIIKT